MATKAHQHHKQQLPLSCGGRGISTSCTAGLFQPRTATIITIKCLCRGQQQITSIMNQQLPPARQPGRATQRNPRKNHCPNIAQRCSSPTRTAASASAALAGNASCGCKAHQHRQQQGFSSPKWPASSASAAVAGDTSCGCKGHYYKQQLPIQFEESDADFWQRRSTNPPRPNPSDFSILAPSLAPNNPLNPKPLPPLPPPAYAPWSRLCGAEAAGGAGIFEKKKAHVAKELEVSKGSGNRPHFFPRRCNKRPVKVCTIPYL